MSRIFTTLSVLALVLLCGNLVLGLSIGDYNRVARQWVNARFELGQLTVNDSRQERSAAEQRLQRSQAELRPIELRKRWHVWSGFVATLIVLLVNSITVTYFIGTSRWCREVVEAYGDAHQLAHESARLKSSSFPWAVSCIGVLLAIIVLGAAADLTANFRSAENWVLPHTIAATFGSLWIAWSFRAQGRKLARNHQLIGQVLQRVQEIQSESVHSASE